MRWLDAFVQDFRYGIRLLARNTGFATATILTVALGIGATTAVFTVVYGHRGARAPAARRARGWYGQPSSARRSRADDRRRIGSLRGSGQSCPERRLAQRDARVTSQRWGSRCSKDAPSPMQIPPIGSPSASSTSASPG